jgi:hypothetical protein
VDFVLRIEDAKNFSQKPENCPMPGASLNLGLVPSRQLLRAPFPHHYAKTRRGLRLRAN